MSNILTIPVLEPEAIVRPEGLKSNAVISPSWFPSVATLDLDPEESAFSLHSNSGQHKERSVQWRQDSSRGIVFMLNLLGSKNSIVPIEVPKAAKPWLLSAMAATLTLRFERLVGFGKTLPVT